jgi:SAM-dependent methyltransferase
MTSYKKDQNLDQEVINGFGHEWAAFDYSDNKSDSALDDQFLAYVSPIDLKVFNKNYSVAADFGAGSGRWTARLLPHFSKIYALEPSDGGFKVLVGKFTNEQQIEILKQTVGDNSIPDESLDLAMSLGVLHHIPNTGDAIGDIAKKLKPDGTFLCYLYYKLDDKPVHYKLLFWISSCLRWIICRLPYKWRIKTAKIVALCVYFPFARIARFLAKQGRDTSNFPLHQYADMPFVMLQNDALDRFGTRLEQRFTKKEITEMLRVAGFDIASVNFSKTEPFWTFSAKKIK